MVDVHELPSDVYDLEEEGIGLYLTDLYIQGATWDRDADQLMESR